MLYSLRFVNIPNILWRHNHHHDFVNKTKWMNELSRWRSTQSISTRPASPVSGTYYRRHWPNVGLMLGQRRKGGQTFNQRLVFAWTTSRPVMLVVHVFLISFSNTASISMGMKNKWFKNSRPRAYSEMSRGLYAVADVLKPQKAL